MYTSITHINLKQIMLRTTIISLALMIGALFFTQSAHAQGKPESPGKSEVAKNKSYSDDDSEAEEEGSEDDDDSDDSNGKSKEIKRMTLRAQEAIARNLERGVGSEQRMLTLSRVLEQLVEIYNRLNDIEDDGGDDTSSTSPLIVEPLSQAATVVDANPDYAMFEFEVDVTGYDTDVIVPEDGVVFSILIGTSTTEVVTTGTTTLTVTSTGSTTPDGFLVAEAETDTLTVQVSYEPAEAGTYRLQLDSIMYDESELELTPAEEYQTDAVEIS